MELTGKVALVKGDGSGMGGSDGTAGRGGAQARAKSRCGGRACGRGRIRERC